MTPPDSRSALVSFAGENVRAKIAPRLARDERNVLALAAHDEGANPERRRQWRIDRPVHGSIRPSYQVARGAVAAGAQAPP